MEVKYLTSTRAYYYLKRYLQASNLTFEQVYVNPSELKLKAIANIRLHITDLGFCDEKILALSNHFFTVGAIKHGRTKDGHAKVTLLVETWASYYKADFVLSNGKYNYIPRVD